MDLANAVFTTESRYFDALLRSDGVALEQVLGSDFLLIDVLTGSEVPRITLVDAVGSGLLSFDSIERLEARVRLYPGSAVVTGQTRLSGWYAGQRFNAHSRYTHVYVHDSIGWRLVSAQGTPVVPAAA